MFRRYNQLDLVSDKMLGESEGNKEISFPQVTPGKCQKVSWNQEDFEPSNCRAGLPALLLLVCREVKCRGMRVQLGQGISQSTVAAPLADLRPCPSCFCFESSSAICEVRS